MTPPQETSSGAAEASSAATEVRVTEPLVSVVIIFLDAARFLQEALDSVVAQTHGSWEVVLVDDGSTDGSSEIAEAFATAHPDRARVVTHPGRENRGMSASRNLGLAHTRGELIAFLDADDVWLPFKLDEQIDLLRRHPRAGVVYGPTEYWFSWTGAAEDRARDFRSRLAVETGRVIEPPELLVRALETHGGMLPGICSLLVRREALEAAGGFEDSFRGSYEDQVFFTKLFSTASILVTDRCSDRYRQHDDSCCAVARRTGEYDPDKPHPARRRYLEWLDGYLAEHPPAAGADTTRRLERALAREWAPYRKPLRHAAASLLGAAATRARRLPRKARPLAKAAAKKLPAGLRARLQRRFRELRFVPPRGWVRFGSLRSLSPISRDYGYDRGTPIDRFYIEAFLARHAADVRGRVLEVGGNTYARRFGGGAVDSVDVLDVHEGNPQATIVADLADPSALGEGAYDCIILTQTLQYVFDLRAAVDNLIRALAPHGVLLATAPGLTQIVECPWRWEWYWGLTDASARKLFHAHVPDERLDIRTPGNVLTTTAFLQGIAAEELRAKELARDDPDYQLLVTVRAEKPTESAVRRMSGRWDYRGRGREAYGDDTTYRLGMEFVDLPGATIEDWGCGLTYAKTFVRHGRYVGVDGSASQFVDRMVDLTRYRTQVDCVFMRHVLEHNPDWAPILDNALASFTRRMALIVFTPFVERTRALDHWSAIPDIAFRKEDLTSRFPEDVHVTEQTLRTETQYGVEHVFLLERQGAIGGDQG